MNTQNLKPFLFGACALAIAGLAPSCVDAGYAYGNPHSGYRSGYEVRTLPYGYREEMIGGSRYYYHNDTYYRRQGTTYVVVDSPRRAPAYRSPGPVRYGSDRRDHDDRHDGGTRSKTSDSRAGQRDGRGDENVRRDHPNGPGRPDGKKKWD